MVKQIIRSILVGYVINKGISLLSNFFDGSGKGITKYKRSNNDNPKK